MPSPDGTAVLGQWSGECEAPSAHMIHMGNVTVGFGNDGELWPESWALGWREDGVALAAITWGACSSQPHGSGVFTVTRDGGIAPLYPTTTGGVIAQLISPNEPRSIPLTELPVGMPFDLRRQFDGLATEAIDIGNGSGALGMRGGDPMITFMCNESKVFVGPVLSDDYEGLYAAAVGFAEQKGCRPMLAQPIECLGTESDPVACRE